MRDTFFCGKESPLVKTGRGPVRGYHDGGLDIFKGIPYGRARRFHRPEPVPVWLEPLDAASYGCVCPLLSMDKPRGELHVPHRYWVQDEDCLNLNVWTPGCDGEKRPVMVWLHGGGYFAGSSIEQVAYEGENMARVGNCVVVSINHRLNILGYLDLSEFGPEYENSGNAGGDDIILALEWVRENIEAFGGDRDNVTVFGQSGGGGKVTTLLQTPAADGLYQKGIIMSGVLSGDLVADCTGGAGECVRALMAELGVRKVSELETVPYVRLAEAYNKVSPALKAQGKNVGCAPCRGRFYLGDPLTNDTGFRPETVGVPLIVSTVFAEFLGFMGETGASAREVLGEKAAEAVLPLFRKAYPDRPEDDLLMLDTVFRGPAIAYIRERAAAGGRVYSCLFEQDFPLYGRTAAWHCADIPFVFHNTELVPVCHFQGARELEEKIFRTVMAFAREDDPGWPASTPEEEKTFLFGPRDRVEVNYDHELIGALQPLAAEMMRRRAGAQIQH